MAQSQLFLRFGVALAIGLLVGMQRQYAGVAEARPPFAGERTFALIGLFGCGAAMAAHILAAPWVLAVLLVPLWALVAISHYFSSRAGDPGMTTEAAALLTSLTGAMCYWGYLPLAVALGVAITVLLSIKVEMEAFVRHLTPGDIQAALKLAVITAIVLPVLPDRPYGPPPLDVLVPRSVWLMVVLISGMSFCGYVLVKAVGARRGISLTGLLGGLASSTAVTLSFTQRSRGEPGLARPFALAITVAWTVMFVRVAVEVAVVHAALLAALWLPLAASALAGLAYCGYLYRTSAPAQAGMEVRNPFALTPALKFGLLYAAVLVVARAAQMHLGDAGLYLSSLVAGAADVDAVALSVARLSRAAAVEPATAARGVVLAALANTALKATVVFVGGTAALRRSIMPGLVAMLAVALGSAWLL